MTETHTTTCLCNADSLVTEELHLQGLWDDTYPHANGVDLVIPAWGMTVAEVVTMWLSEGTVTCRCDEHTESHAITTEEHTMTATATLPAVHTFTASTESRTRCECGKSRNTSAHGYTAKRSAAAAKAETATAKQDALREKAQKVAASADAIEAQVAERIATAKAKALTAPLAVITLDGQEATVEASPTAPRTLGEMEPAERDAVVASAAAQLQEELTRNAPAISAVLAEPLPGEEVDPVAAAIAAAKAEIESHVPTTPKAKGGKAATETERHTSLWVARNMVEGLIGLTATEDAHRASIGRKVDASTPNNRGGRTIRLTEAELRTLREVATEVETAATEASDGMVAMSATKLRGRLDGYLATY